MKNILILTASYGSGHNAAAKGTLKAIQELYPREVKPEIVDLLNVANPDAVSFFRNFYETCMQKYPSFWDKFIRATNKTPWFVRMFDYISTIYYGKLATVLVEKKPDLFVISHPYWVPFAREYNNLTQRNVEIVLVITDSISIHCAWFSTKADYYIVPNEETRTVLLDQCIPAEKIKTIGFPVNPELGKPINRKEILTELGLLPDRLTILVNFGLGKIDNICTLFNRLTQQEPGNWQVIGITGKRTDLYEQLKGIKYSVPTKILGWTDRMYDFLRVSDLIISKAGGAIVMESLAAGKPILNPEFSPGQESGNAILLEKYNAGKIEPDLNKMMPYINELLNNPEKITELTEHAKKIGNPNAAYELAHFCYQLLLNNKN